ncbi:MAG: hypothetical protein AAF242_11780 [Bacteroidota bacterium]
MKKLQLLLACCLVGSFLYSQALSPQMKETIDALSEADLSEGSPGVAVGIVKNGVVVYEFYGGGADLKKEIPIF